jgi:hypothetical protein
MVICLLCAQITIAERDSRTWCARLGRDNEVFPSIKRCLGTGDRRHAETNYRNKNSCLGITNKRYKKTDCKINPLVGRGEEPGGFFEEWSWNHNKFWKPVLEA